MSASTPNGTSNTRPPITDRIKGSIKSVFTFLFSGLFIGIANAAGTAMFLLENTKLPWQFLTAYAAFAAFFWGYIYYTSNPPAKATNPSNEDSSNESGIISKIYKGFIYFLANINPSIGNGVGMAVGTLATAQLMNITSKPALIAITACGFLAGFVAAWRLTRVAMPSFWLVDLWKTQGTKEATSSKGWMQKGIYYVVASLASLTAGAVLCNFYGSQMNLILGITITFNGAIFALFTFKTRKGEKEPVLVSLNNSLAYSASYLAIITSIAIAAFNFLAGESVIRKVSALFGHTINNSYLNYMFAALGALLTFFAAASFYMLFAQRSIIATTKRGLLSKKTIDALDAKLKESELGAQIKNHLSQIIEYAKAHEEYHSNSTIVTAAFAAILLAAGLGYQIFHSIKNDLKEFFNAKVCTFLAFIITIASAYLCFMTFFKPGLNFFGGEPSPRGKQLGKQLEQTCLTSIDITEKVVQALQDKYASQQDVIEFVDNLMIANYHDKLNKNLYVISSDDIRKNFKNIRKTHFGTKEQGFKNTDLGQRYAELLKIRPTT